MAKRVLLGILAVAGSVAIGVVGADLWLRWQDRSTGEAVVTVAPGTEAERAAEARMNQQAELGLATDTSSSDEAVSRVGQQQAIAIAHAALAADPRAFAPERIEARMLDWGSPPQPMWAVMFTVADPNGGRLDFLHHAAVWVDPDSGEVHQVDVSSASQTIPTTTLHPQVQAQGLEMVTEIVERYSDVWHWPSPALDAANLSFFEELPAECSSTIGCYNHWTGDIWLSLDALRLEPDFFNRHSAADVVLHELAHAYTRSNPHGAELLDLFAGHYAGCRRDGRGTTPAVDADQLPAELLADAMAMTATDSSERRDYGYFADGGFDGCLADSRQPPQALIEAVYSTLFNCQSTPALDAFERIDRAAERTLSFEDDPTNTENYRTDDGALIVPSWVASSFGTVGFKDTETNVLKACFDIDCNPSECTGWSNSDERQVAAREQLHELRCRDGLLYPGNWVLERAGWEPGCEAHVPDDVECVVIDPSHALLPGRLEADGTCAEIEQ